MASTVSSMALCLSGPQNPSLSLSALCWSTPSRNRRAPSSTMRSRSGRALAPTSSASDSSRSASARRLSARARAIGPTVVSALDVPAGEQVGVARERAVPADGRIVPRVREIAVEGPEATHEALGVRGDRLGEVAARRRHRRDHGHRTLAAAERLDAPGPLVERGERRRQTGRVALLGRQLAGA